MRCSSTTTRPFGASEKKWSWFAKNGLLLTPDVQTTVLVGTSRPLMFAHSGQYSRRGFDQLDVDLAVLDMMRMGNTAEV
jgi:hypothetical protein